MDVDEGGRTVLEASRIISDLGMKVGTLESYKAYLTLLKGM